MDQKNITQSDMLAFISIQDGSRQPNKVLILMMAKAAIMVMVAGVACNGGGSGR